MTDQGQKARELDHLNKPIPLWCRIGWHKWGGWSNPYPCITSPILEATGITPTHWQKRMCLRCGRVEERMV